MEGHIFAAEHRHIARGDDVGVIGATANPRLGAGRSSHAADCCSTNPSALPGRRHVAKIRPSIWWRADALWVSSVSSTATTAATFLSARYRWHRATVSDNRDACNGSRHVLARQREVIDGAAGLIKVELAGCLEMRLDVVDELGGRATDLL